MQPAAKLIARSPGRPTTGVLHMERHSSRGLQQAVERCRGDDRPSADLSRFDFPLRYEEKNFGSANANGVGGLGDAVCELGIFGTVHCVSSQSHPTLGGRCGTGVSDPRPEKHWGFSRFPLRPRRMTIYGH